MQHREVKDEGEVAKDYADRHNQDSINRVLAEARRPISTTVYLCEDCHTPIPKKRHKAQPGCTRCVECQRLFERLEAGL